MKCPVCTTDAGAKDPICSRCGTILSSKHLNQSVPRPKIKRGVKLRLFAVVIAGIIGAFGFYALMNAIPAMRANRPYGALIGAILGAAAVYTFTSIKIIYRNRNYRQRLGELKGRLDQVLDSAEERYTQAQKLGESIQITKARLATLHLVRNETHRSIEEFKEAEESGAHDAAFFNNYGVALVRTGRRPQALAALEEAAEKDDDNLQPLINFAHAVLPPDIHKNGATTDIALEHIKRALERKGPSFEVLEREGIILLQGGRLEEAKLEFGRAFEQAAGNKRFQADAKNNLGIDRMLAGELRDAADEFRGALALDAGHARALSNLGLSSLMQNRMMSGLESLIQARDLEPNTGVILNNLGFGMCVAKSCNEAISLYRKAITYDPFLWEAYYNLGKLYVDEGIFEHAERYLDRVIEMRPETWEALVALGVAKIKTDEPSSAAEILRRAYDLAPKEPSVLTNLGIALSFVFEYDESERLLQLALKDNVNDPLAWARLGWMHIMQGIPKMAADELKRAIGLAPKDAVYNNYYALANIETGAPDVAMIYFKRALNCDPKYGVVHYHIGYVHMMRRNLDGAIKSWEQTVIVEPEFPDGFVNLGVALYEKGDLEGAVMNFRKALVLRQDRMEDYSNLALAFSKQGVMLKLASKSPGDRRHKAAFEKFMAAIEMFDKALEMDPNNVVLHSNRGLACWYAEKVDDACVEWTTVAHLNPDYAARRGELMKTAFDETSLAYAVIKVAQRMFGFPLETAGYRFRIAPGYNADKWDLIIEDDELATVPDIVGEVDFLERNIRGLHV